MLFIDDKLTYYVDALHQIYIPKNQSKFDSLSVKYHPSIIQKVSESKEYLFELFSDDQLNNTVYAGPLLFGKKLLGVLYVDGLNSVSDESRRIFQVLGSLIVTYMELGNKLALEIEKIVLTTKTEELEKSNMQLKELRDKAQQSERAKAVFLMNMSHELRTPLNAVCFFFFLFMI